jgi:dolichol-phosphate mannosyltransferase
MTVPRQGDAIAPVVSIVLPVFNEAPSLPILCRELDAALGRIGKSAEVIFVDDGSTDGGVGIIRGFGTPHASIRLLRLERHRGLTAALHAGLTAARGQVIVTMDSDLQSDPGDLPALLEALASADAVVGWRRIRHDSLMKRLSSRLANRVRDWLTGHHVRDSACGMRAMRRACLDAIPPLDGMHRFFATLLWVAGYHVIEVPVHHRPRRFGRSNFGVANRAARALQDLLAVRWMINRRLRYTIVERVEIPAAALGSIEPDRPT